MDRETYQQRKEDRIERLQERAERLNRESSGLLNTARTMAQAIPLGQPILVGHHSERGDRNYRARIDSKYRKAFEMSDQADDLARRAAAAESNRAISSDNPDAVDLLKEKLAKLEETRAKFRKLNELLRKNDLEGLKGMGLDEAQIENLKKPDFAGRVGIADYQFSNLAGRVRQIKQRIAALEVKPAQDRKVELAGGITVTENTWENRVQIKFPGKPSEEVREKLKGRGFRWSPTQGVWQRQLTNSAIWAARDIVKILEGGTTDAESNPSNG